MRSIRILLLPALLLLSVACKKEESKTVAQEESSSSPAKVSNQKIVSLSGGVTEIISALGYENEIVGTDVTSVYPESLKSKAKDLGHVRTMTIEPIMALSPTIIFGTENEMNPELFKKIKESGIKTEFFKQEFSVDGTKKLIEQVATALGDKDYQTLYTKIDEGLAKLHPIAKKPKVLFIYARGNNLMVAGKNTPMANIINIAGGENVANDFESFKPLTPEALVQYNPDVLLFFSSGLQSAGGIDGVLKTPGVAQTNAGKNKKIIAMDGGLMSSFGPRLGEAALSLNKLLVESTQ